MTEKQLHVKETLQSTEELIKKITAQCNSLKCNTDIPIELQISVLKVHNLVSELDRNCIKVLSSAVSKLK